MVISIGLRGVTMQVQRFARADWKW